MIFDRQKYLFIFQDAVYSSAVGFITGFVSRFLSLFLHKGKIKVFIKDFIVSVVFSLFLYSYVISFANYKVLRWYNVIFALAGYAGFTPIPQYAVNFIVNILTAIKKKLWEQLTKRIKTAVLKISAENKEKHQKNTIKNSPEPLKEQGVVLYN